MIFLLMSLKLLIQRIKLLFLVWLGKLKIDSQVEVRVVFDCIYNQIYPTITARHDLLSRLHNNTSHCDTRSLRPIRHVRDNNRQANFLFFAQKTKLCLRGPWCRKKAIAKNSLSISSRPFFQRSGAIVISTFSTSIISFLVV